MPTSSMISDDEDDAKSFTSARSVVDPDSVTSGHEKQSQDETRFSSEEEASNELKTSANALFAKGAYNEAIPLYSRALAACPAYLDYETGVLNSNTAACHIKLLQWEEAISAATKCLDSLDRLDAMPAIPSKDQQNDSNDSAVKELDHSTEQCMDRLSKSGHTLDEVSKLRCKALLRRAKARVETGTWASLQGADEDYRYLLTQSLSPTDLRTVKTESKALIPRLESAKEREMAEMMGKLKGLGNSLLRPFGLSTENFNFVKDQSTGNYSMNFSQRGGGGGGGEAAS